MKKSSSSRKKKDYLSLHKEEAWKAFSRYIRLRDAILTTGTLEKGVCVTCPNVYPVSGRGYAALQAGHFLAGRGNSLLFDERNCHAQCGICNMPRHGNYENYQIYMEKTYGFKIIQELRELRGVTRKITREEFDQIKDTYTAKYEELLQFPERAHLMVPEQIDSELPF